MDLRPQSNDFSVDDPINYQVERQRGEPAAIYIYGIFDGNGNPIDFDIVDLTGARRGRITAPTLPTGEYELRIAPLDENQPQGIGNVSFDAFTVGPDRVPRVELTRRTRTVAAQPDGPCPSYAGFRVFLEANLEPAPDLPDAFGASPPPVLTPRFGIGAGSYDQLMGLARLYVQDCRCEDLRDLAPPNYIEERAANNPGWISRSPENDLPCIELLFCYWLEEGMLVQTINHVVARFQNRRVSTGDPLARFDVSPLLPLRSLMWSWVENEQRRLTIRRRAAEYQFEYGLALVGKAVPAPNTLVERRSGFLAAFHTILNLATKFFKELDDLTVNPDGFPIYEALRECHLLMSQGSQNQYGEMAVAARAEMLVMQHLLAQPPMREFLGGRPMTPYPEPWMDRVDSMKAIQGWSPASVLHFFDLAAFGERLALTIRLGNWVSPVVGANEAVTWVTAFRPVIQRYIAAYRAVTGVDLTDGVETTMPSTLLSRRLRQASRGA